MDPKETLTKALIILAVSLTTGSSHSLKYIHTGETQGTNLKKYTVVGLVDEEEFVTYDITTKKMVPKTEWIEKNEGADYWKCETQTMQEHEYWFRGNTDTLKKCFSQTDGVYKWQWMYSCELDEDGSTSGNIQYGFNGDFITVDLYKGTWTEDNSDALTCFTKLKTDAYQYLIEHQKDYVQNKCIDYLKQYIGYGGGSLKRKGCGANRRQKQGTDESNCEHVTHSMQYIVTAVTQGIDFPEFTEVGNVDGELFTYYDSNSRNEIPKTEWIKKIDADDPDYWSRNTQRAQRTQESFKVNVATLMERFNQTKGVHTVQWMYGCELHDDGTKMGYRQYGYDGEDFISLDLKTLTWTAANNKAVITKLKWEGVSEASRFKAYVENECIDYLKKYVGYGRATLERKDPPEVTLFQKDSSSPVVCHATGFFPRAVMISWQKNGEDLFENVELRETSPNQDGTFQKRSILTVSPEELDKNEYTCVVQHSGLEKDLVLKGADRKVLNTGGVSVGVIVGVVVVLLLLVLIGCVGFFIWKKKNEKTSDFKPVARSSGGRSTPIMYLSKSLTASS